MSSNNINTNTNANNNMSQQTITAETVRRLLKDVKYIIKNPLTDNGIYYSHDESNMLVGYALIVGPEDTPYYGGYYFFKFNYPSDYPYSPPKATYMTNDGKTRFNPNLYKCGKVCVSLLNTWSGDKWTSCQTINSVLLTLCSLLNKYPLYNEPGQNEKSRDFIPYHKSIEYENIRFAICDMINKTTNKIPEPFQIFYSYMVENFNKSYDKIIAFIESKELESKESNNIEESVVSIYCMRTKLDYNALKQKLIKTKEYIDSL